MTANHATTPSTRFCMEINAAPCVVVLFGATGDLAARKLLPALYELHALSLLHATSRIVGCGRTALDDAAFRERIAQALPADAPADVRDTFLNRLGYEPFDAGDPASFARLAQRLGALDRLETPAPFNRLYYLAVPTGAMQPIISRLAETGLLTEDTPTSPKRQLLVEKPFGSDLRTAEALDAFLKQHVREDQIYRIDHYLGKNTVQNIVILRFANLLFNPVWNADFVDHVQITAAETLGVENRAAYYDKAGAVRDMFQNHLLELLALVAMEPPASFDSEAIHQARLDVVRAIRPFPLDDPGAVFVRGQYRGYRAEPGVAPDSDTETFAAIKLEIDTPRWRGAPFYLRSGKRLATRVTTVTLVFKPTPNDIFGAFAPNKLTLRIQPDEGVRLHLQAKIPGPKFCIGDLPLSFRYADLAPRAPRPDGYARLLLDAMLHDPMLFVRNDTIAASWALFTPVLERWRNDPDACPLHDYEPGSTGPDAADALLARDGRAWETLEW
ncbi:MAG: glucose-6-phosphate dehydrogenase [Kiritimatiellia bacterium]|jgi:glucose-6-phosphate 1-dehydrogenase